MGGHPVIQQLDQKKLLLVKFINDNKLTVMLEHWTDVEKIITSSMDEIQQLKLVNCETGYE